MSDRFANDEELAERLVVSFESIAKSMAGIDESVRKAVSKTWPDPREPRQAVVSRVQTEEDKIRQAQGVSSKPIREWLTELDDDELIGEREREFIERQKRDAGAKTSEGGEPGPRGSEPPEDQPGQAGDVSTNNADPKTR